MVNYGTNLRAPKVDVHDFSMVPKTGVPRSSFRMQTQHKTTMQASVLLPVYLQEVLPGDSFSLNMTAFCRLATPLFPIMDQLDIETAFFFVPNRLVWNHWVNFQGEQINPADSISYTIPQVVSPVGGFAQLTIFDWFGLPCTGQTAGGNTISISALPFRAYNQIWNQWFRDENLNNSLGTGATNTASDIGDGPDPYTNYSVQKINKRHDYFTSCLPWTQKGGAAITLPLGTSAPIRGIGWNGSPSNTNASSTNVRENGGITRNYANSTGLANWSTNIFMETDSATLATMRPTIFADLTAATSATINSLRLAFQTQRLLERDARGGTRYVEIILSHFGIRSPDARLQRPEYLGGGKTPLTITPVPQTTATGLTGGTSPLGTLAAAGTVIAKHGFNQSFTEHGHIIGLAWIRSTPGYQQGIRKLWSRLTRYDFYLPVFQALGEQAVLNKEIYSDGSANDANTFGYQERWAEYRYHPSYTSAYFKSTTTTPLDAWHLVEKFTSLPTLASTFIGDSTSATLQRALAAGAAAGNQQILADLFFDVKAARPMPMYSVPGMIDHF
ncbi:MAG: major capsid protein [Microvirus sp.]|nr:MAG: major capsid protein [Microvirus sp.]